MNLKKPKFWDYKKPNIYAYLLLPIALLIKILNLFKIKSKTRKFKIKTICVGNIYVGGTGKTSLSIKINEILNKKKISSCFIKKFYKDQIDEQKLLQSKGKIFTSSKRLDAVALAENENYEIGIHIADVSHYVLENETFKKEVKYKIDNLTDLIKLKIKSKINSILT